MEIAHSAFNCSMCSAVQVQYLPIPFVYVCNSCQNLIEKVNENLFISLNKKNEELSIVSIPTISCTGNYSDKEFIIPGLIRSITNAEINEYWLCLFKDGSKKWLRKIENDWYLFDDESIVLSSSLIKSKKAGNYVVFKDVKYIIKWISKEIESKISGQIPSKKYFVALAFKILLVTEDGKEVIDISLFDQNHVIGDKGKLIQLSDLSLSSLNYFSYWN